jgi:hypothetical protein
MASIQEMWRGGVVEVGQCEETYASEAYFPFPVSPILFQPLLFFFFCERTGEKGRYTLWMPRFLHVLTSLVGLVL